MARITVEDCIDKFPSRFELVLVASQRARKLYSGDEPTVEKDNDKNTVIALREIADTSITVDEMKENLIQEYQTVTINDEEEENLEIESLELQTESTEKKSEILSDKEIEDEMKELVSSEDKEIENQYEISDNLDQNIDTENIDTENIDTENIDTENIDTENIDTENIDTDDNANLKSEVDTDN